MDQSHTLYYHLSEAGKVYRTMEEQVKQTKILLGEQTANLETANQTYLAIKKLYEESTKKG